ncbi:MULTISPECIES: DsbA family protein [Ensifer]|uniref:2-hydroxychromene-2-carboxylate isomerase n=1 Tax=Ensifer TaxID=106591 RepID=UPI00046CFCBF|nr:MULTISPECIES: DsbA family protein [unclassified Ensifer]MDP9633508.1 2-hydroxychromene-2-carboxylate isomerase [Ensifer adhaerens]NOV20366.1 2-hydroxychromene-2-carboxylate isomerase [Ensifer canadensis]KQU89187.1 2-hydroxychromene-2-carboxylate isomerase [Ensifer sp. Root31]KQY73344.1 2-hydroxychromene-2-carboxylate isomerase [Ensifer sp. Root142]MBD9491057.1 DsbA family protein [Ensifer sp. ENS11]
MTKSIDYFFSIGSPWSFIGLEAFAALARRHEAAITPYMATVVEENGGIFSRNRPQARRAYGTRDLKRWSRVRGRELLLDGRPPLADPTPASRMVIATYLDGKDWFALTEILQEAFWVRAEDIGRSEVREAVATRAGFDGSALLARESAADVVEKWASDREHTLKSGVFGFPTFGYDGEIYWGQDNLPFLEQHLQGERP